MPFSKISAIFVTKCAFVLLFCFSANPSPILIDDLAPSIIGVAVEDRIANPPSAIASEGRAAARPAMGSAIELLPSVIGVEVEDRIAVPSSGAASSSSSSATSSDLVSIDGLLSPDVTSVDVSDEDRAHREEIPDKKDDDICDGEGCHCPPGTKGIQPFCIPDAPAVEVPSPDEFGEPEIPIEFYQKIAGVKSLEQFVNITKINIGLASSEVKTTHPAEGCIPKKVCVSVRPKNRHPSEDVFPNSIDVERCGGCCGHPDLTCLPWSTEPMTVNLLKYGYNHDGTISHLGYMSTSVIREVKCKCVKVQT